MEIVIVRKCLILLGVGLLVCFYQNSVAQDSCPADKTPENIAVYKGRSASFSRANNGQAVRWQVIPSSSSNSPTMNITYDNDTVIDEFNSVYAANKSALIIFNSTVAPQGSMNYSTAGMYIINYVSCIAGAWLLVIESGPVCSCDDSNPSDFRVTLTCRVIFATYNAQQVNATMTWKNNSQVVFRETPPGTSPPGTSVYSNPGLVSSASQYLVAREDGSTFECQLAFGGSMSNQSPYVAKNEPNFTASCFVGLHNCGATTTIATQQPTTAANQLTTTKSIDTGTSPPPSTTTGKSNPTVSNVSIDPTFGPVAGGTVVTITTTWSYDNVSITAVYIGNNLQADYFNRSGENLLLKTPSIRDESLTNQPLLITLEVSTYSTNVSTGKYFTYKPNPRINDTRPRELLLSGGIRLNITGSNLDSVARPLIIAVVNISSGSNITYNNESFGSCEFPTHNGSQMICLSPPFDIRDDFLEHLFNGTYLISTNQTYTSTNKQEELKLNVGMLFDGFDIYKYNILRDSNGDFDIFYPPSILCKDYLEFNPQEEDTITIQGDDLTRGCGKVDYAVRIGNETCSVEDLTDNTLTFNPPKAKPQQTANDMHYCGENFAIFIGLGYKTYKCSCLSYPDYATELIIIVVATVGSSLTVIIFIIVASVVIRRSRKRKMNSSQEPSLYQSSLGSTGMILGSEHLYNASPASDEGAFQLYQTHIHEGWNTGYEKINMNEIRRIPSDHLISYARRSVYQD